MAASGAVAGHAIKISHRRCNREEIPRRRGCADIANLPRSQVGETVFARQRATADRRSEVLVAAGKNKTASAMEFTLISAIRSGVMMGGDSAVSRKPVARRVPKSVVVAA
jgi:hypothetical protein